MSKILALDSSTEACSVALADNGVVVEQFELAPRGHTKRMLPMVDSLLADHQLSLHDLDAIAFGRGPGSFTGLRICMGMVQGLAFGADLPLIPVSTLEAMAVGACRELSIPEEASLLVSLDARMNEIYWTCFSRRGDQLVSLGEECVQSPELAITESILSDIDEPLIGIGQGWNYTVLEDLQPRHVFKDYYPHAYDIAMIAVDRLARGDVVDVIDAQPVYLRDKVSWKKRQRIRSTASDDNN